MAFLDNIRRLSAAVAFAEAGEYETAREVAESTTLPDEARSGILQSIQNMAVAAAFAEEGLHREAIDLLNPAPDRSMAPPKPSFLDVVGLQRAPVHVLVAAG